MQNLTIPRTDLATSRLGLGYMRIAEMGVDAVEQLVMTALDEGITFFDHADIYGAGTCEHVFGDVLARNPGLRERMVIQSKCDIVTAAAGGPRYDTSRDYLIASVEGSLERLRCDHLDILLLHRPDPLCDPAEVAEAVGELRERGLVRHIGVSNHGPARIELLAKHLGEMPVANQMQLSLIHNHMINADVFVDMAEAEGVDRDGGTLNYCQLHDILVQAWCPLQASWADGTFIDNPKFPELNGALAKLAAEHGVTKAAIALAWIMRLPARIQPIVGTTSPAHLREAARAADIELTRQQWYDLYQAALGHPIP